MGKRIWHTLPCGKTDIKIWQTKRAYHSSASFFVFSFSNQFIINISDSTCNHSANFFRQCLMAASLDWDCQVSTALIYFTLTSLQWVALCTEHFLTSHLTQISFLSDSGSRRIAWLVILETLACQKSFAVLLIRGAGARTASDPGAQLVLPCWFKRGNYWIIDTLCSWITHIKTRHWSVAHRVEKTIF